MRGRLWKGMDMTAEAVTGEAQEEAFNTRLAILLAMAMFVLVVDTSLMNVSISAVVQDLGTTVSGVQSAIALEALVSAAFILLSSKIGDLIGRKRAYTLGLLGYAIGALAMTLAQDLFAIIIFWAIFGGLGASLLLPSMQSLIHGNFEGAQQKRVYALTGASAAIAAAIGPLLGGFVTTFLSWRVGFLIEVIIIAVVLLGLGLVKDVPYTGDRRIDLVGALFSIVGMGGVVLGILVWQEGGEAVGALIAIGVVGSRPAGLVAHLSQAAGQGCPAGPGSSAIGDLPPRHQRTDAPADLAGRADDRPADLPADGPRVQRAGGRNLALPALADDVRGRDACRTTSRQAPAERRDPHRLRARGARDRRPHRDRAARGQRPRHGTPAGRGRGRASGCSSRSSTTTRSPRSPRNASAKRRA